MLKLEEKHLYKNNLIFHILSIFSTFKIFIFNFNKQINKYINHNAVYSTSDKICAISNYYVINIYKKHNKFMRFI